MWICTTKYLHEYLYSKTSQLIGEKEKTRKINFESSSVLPQACFNQHTVYLEMPRSGHTLDPVVTVPACYSNKPTVLAVPSSPPPSFMPLYRQIGSQATQIWPCCRCRGILPPQNLAAAVIVVAIQDASFLCLPSRSRRNQPWKPRGLAWLSLHLRCPWTHRGCPCRRRPRCSQAFYRAAQVMTEVGRWVITFKRGRRVVARSSSLTSKTTTYCSIWIRYFVEP